MGLRRSSKPVIWRVCVPEELSVAAELFLASNKGRPQYGIRSQWITKLIEKDLKERGLLNQHSLIPEPESTSKVEEPANGQLAHLD